MLTEEIYPVFDVSVANTGVVYYDAEHTKSAYSKEWFVGEGVDTDRYVTGGTKNIATWETFFPLLAAADKNETQPISVSYSNSVLSINGRTVAELKNDFYQSLNAGEDPALAAVYTDDHVDGLFSSGKVTLELKFYNVGDAGVAVNIANIGNVLFNKPYENNFESQAETGGTYDAPVTETVTGTKFEISAEPVVLGDISSSQLENAVSFQLLPNGVNRELAANNLTITLRDSKDTSKFVNVIVTKSTAWDTGDSGLGGGHTSAYVTLEDKFTFDSWGYVKLADTSQEVVAKDNTKFSQYADIGSPNAEGREWYTGYGTMSIGQWASWYPLLGAEEGRHTKPISVSYKNSTVYVNGIEIADLKNDNYQKWSTNSLDTTANADIIAKYTDEYVDNLFSSGKVIVELRFGGAYNGSVNVLSFGGQSAANLQLGNAGAKDTLAPVITAISGDTYDAETNTFTVEKDTQYTVSELAAITAADVMDPAPVTGIEVYNKDGVQYETAAVTFAEGDYVILYAVDADGNRSEVRASVAFAAAQTTYTVTYTDGSGTNATVAEGETYTFAAAEQAGKSFAGWVINGKLYPANYETAVTENLEVSALFLSFATGDAELAGEGIIRWYTRIDAEDHAALTALADVRFGTLITCDSKAGYLDIATNVWAVEGAEYRAAFTDIPAEMYGASFTGTGYAIVAYENGVSAVVYASGSTVSVDGLSA